ncbi:hypothetical protein Dda_6109 [Drechslerella dactyloides]|uniref:Altered inheritance of mitochondria protein 6 n=1 Tax=Drechslerella dactyloides TaxID=74499 RepID=A0AAD6NGY5_DREDA|nr:hypothetical protein Dda_6109 [Drechslerella dactyloides]
MPPRYVGRLHDGVIYRDRSSPEERFHETIRVIVTYVILNICSIVLIHLNMAPLIDPHFYRPVTTDKVGFIIFRIFSGAWAIITGFYNLTGCMYALRWLRKQWKKEDDEGEFNSVIRTQSNAREEGEGRATGATLWESGGRPARGAVGSTEWFANNNPYTAVRRTHSGTFAAARRTRRQMQQFGAYRLPVEHEPIMEEPTDVDEDYESGTGINSTAGRVSERSRPQITFPNVPPRGVTVPRIADSYPFAPEELAASSTTTWSNSATSAGDLAKKKAEKKRADKRKENKAPKPKDEEDEGEQNATTEGGLTSRKTTKLKHRASDASSVSAGSDASGSASEGSEGDVSKPSSARRRRGHRSTSDRPDAQSEQESDRSQAIEKIVRDGSYHDQQATFRHLNKAIWSEVGEQMQRLAALDQQPASEKSSSVKPQATPDDSKVAPSAINSNSAPIWKRWLGPQPPSMNAEPVINEKSSQPPQESPARNNEPADRQPDETQEEPTPKPYAKRCRRMTVLAAGAIFATIVTLIPPFLTIGGSMVAHDYQFVHGCDKARWDIRLDASGLHPERDNVYNRAIFKDHQGRGFEKEFMMNLEGMATYGVGLDASLVKKHRGYVFYLSDRDLAKQPDGGENVLFPYPVIVAYDNLKHAFYPHDDIWRDLNNDAFFDTSAFMNVSMTVFPSEGIWLEKEEQDGYCGQPKRVLKNNLDQRIIWTVVDDRKDCTVMKVCGSPQATRRQVVIAVGTLLQRLAVSSTCCSKAVGDSAPVGSEVLFGFIVQYLLFAPSVVAAKPEIGLLKKVWKPFGHVAQYVEQWAQKTGLDSYPTSFTRGIEPKKLHSHNDYWRDVPFYQGLSYGAISTEADVWAIDGELLVGHEKTALSPKRTFQSLYVNPIVEVLTKQNPTNKYVNKTSCGVFDQECHQTLYLWVDLKTDAESTWPLVVAQLAPLREKNWLSKWDGKVFLPGPVTVIGTGAASWKVVVGNKTRPRDYFVDAPLLDIGTDSEPKDADGKTPLYDDTTSLFATASLLEMVGYIGREMSPKQLKTVETAVKNAKSRGLQSRIWQTPNWPTQTRRKVWRQLMDVRVGLLNVDDLEDAANGDW